MASEKDGGAPTQSEAGAVSQAARTSVPDKSEPVAEEAAGEKRGVEELGADAASQDAAKKSRGDDAGARSARGRGGSGHGRGRRGRGRGAERAVCARDSGDGQADSSASAPSSTNRHNTSLSSVIQVKSDMVAFVNPHQACRYSDSPFAGIH